MQSVLAKATKDQIVTDPYPHIIIEDALDADLYRRLSDEFPGREVFEPNEMHLHNSKYVRNGRECMASDAISPLWKDFIRYHMSNDYYQEVVALFSDHLRSYFDVVETTLGKRFEDMTITHRQRKYLVPDMSFPHDVMLDCQPQCDYTFTKRSFRGPHVDSPTELYAGLFYLREDGDESTGGGIGVWRAKDENVVFPAPRSIEVDYHGKVVDGSKIELVYEIPYRPNCLVMFLNTWRSLHCAQTRTPTLYPRRAVNIIGEICRYPRNERLFDLLLTPELQALIAREKREQKRPSLLRQVAARVLGR